MSRIELKMFIREECANSSMWTLAKKDTQQHAWPSACCLDLLKEGADPETDLIIVKQIE